MARYAALLRGVNVGGRLIEMATLRLVLEDLGYADVGTYLRSGNAVFSHPERSCAALAGEIEEQIGRTLEMSVPVMVRTGAELADVVGRCPLPGEPDNPSRFFVAFLTAVPDAAAARQIEARDFGHDRIWVSGAEAFLWCPNGAAHTPLSNAAVEKGLGVSATSRNWNTVRTLVRLTSEP